MGQIRARLRRAWAHDPTKLEGPAFHVAGLGPGTGGIAHDLVQRGFVEPVVNRGSQCVTHGIPLELRTFREPDHSIGGGKE
ncbi:MAG: hypothetical protein LC114_01115 [Bryobacterales bacterium]|nr:hypothetical protein [Bryobacterales bacterium]